MAGAVVADVSSSRARLQWPRVNGATAIRVFLAPEPAAAREPTEETVAGTATVITPERGPLKHAKRLAALPGTATEYDIGTLAASVDAFIRLEADTPRGKLIKDLHVRTKGGPRARLDSAVREVHAWSPTILEVVLAGGDGPGWQSGTWTVKRANGNAIEVVRVNRRSMPVEQPNYTTNYDEYGNLDTRADHHIYLQLKTPIGSSELLQITGPTGLNFTLPFSDRYLETPVIQVNQVGYNPRATKRYAYLSGWMGSGGPLSLESFPASAEVLADSANAIDPRRVALASASIRRRASGNDPAAGAPVFEIDLAALPSSETAVYRVRIPGVGVSWPTQVSELAVFKSYWDTARGIFHNRWGGDLRADLTDWTRPIDHGRVFTAEQTNAFDMFPENTPKTGERALTAGYHDAGDFDQRPMHTVVAQVLMRAYEFNPSLYVDNQLKLPESGNGIPDQLDEALWGVRGWEQLQEQDGGVRSGVESFRHPAGAAYLASDDKLPYWTFARDANVSARVAGLFAQASRLVRPFDQTRADALKDRAVRAWRWASSHGAGQAAAFYALGELWRATGEASYKMQFEQRWRAMGEVGVFSSFAGHHLASGDYGDPNGRVMPDFILGYLTGPGADPQLVEISRTWISNAANEVTDRLLGREGFAHRSARQPGYPLGWGQATVMGRYLDTVIARIQLGGLTPAERQRYFDALSLGQDFMLGCNPLGMSFVTGLGSRSPLEPLHLDSLVFIKRGLGPVPGIPVYGPVDDEPGPEWYQPGLREFYPSFMEHPSFLRYGDVRTFVNMNEFTIWETMAPTTEHFAVMLGSAMTPPSSWMPGQRNHRNPLPAR